MGVRGQRGWRFASLTDDRYVEDDFRVDPDFDETANDKPVTAWSLDHLFQGNGPQLSHI